MQINEILQFSLQKTMFDMYQKRGLHLFFKSRFPTLSFGTHHKRSMIPSLFLRKKKNQPGKSDFSLTLGYFSQNLSRTHTEM